MTNQVLIDKLPESIKQQVLNYANYLVEKYYAEKKSKKGKRPKFGSAKGKYKMSADFDAPLEDFKDYM